MVIKYAADKDKQSVKDIWSICFPEDHDPFLSWFFDTVYKPSNTLAAYTGDTMLANLQLIPYIINFNNIPLNIRYLVGAATLPLHRKKGIMAQLLKEAIIEAKHSECPFILLLPFNYAFYKKFGWEACYFHNQYSTCISNIKKHAVTIGKTMEVSVPFCIPDLDTIYTRSNSSRSGWILRTNSDWLNILQDHLYSDGLVSIFTDNDGLQAGYMLYKIENGTFEIVELAYLNHEAASSLWNYIAEHYEVADKVLWRAPFDDISYMFFDDPRSTCSVEAFVMARAIDVEKILQILVSELSINISIYLEIEDPLASWNNGFYHIFQTCDKQANISRINPNNTLTDVVHLSINTFSMLSMGVISPVEALSYGLINKTSQNMIPSLEIIFKKTINFMNENF